MKAHVHKWTFHILWRMCIPTACISPYQQRLIVGWPQGCVLWRRLVLSEHTWGILLVAMGLARGRNGRDIWAKTRTETFSLQPLCRQKGTERCEKNKACLSDGMPWLTMQQKNPANSYQLMLHIHILTENYCSWDEIQLRVIRRLCVLCLLMASVSIMIMSCY